MGIALAGIERHHQQLSAELAPFFKHSSSRTDDSLLQLDKEHFWDVGDLHKVLLKFVKASAVYDGIGVAVRASAAVTAILHRQRGNEESEVDENPMVCRRYGVTHGRWHQPISQCTEREAHRCPTTRFACTTFNADSL